MARPRTPGVVMGIVAVVLLVLIAGLALTQRQPPPPSIAEFAPQAVDNITEAPSDQGASQGRGEGTGTGGASATTPAPSPTPISVLSVRKCVGDPPRQIEDPQSPPCVPSWTGDNGGATWKGVTRDEVTIAVPWNGANLVPEWNLLQQFFNRRFEFYGRKLTLKVINVGGDSGADARPDAQQAHAVAADDEKHAFAALPYPDTGGSQVFYDELASRQIVSVIGLVPREQEPYLQSKHPYEWTYVPTIDKSSRNLGTWACRTLAGKTAKYAGGVEMGKPRVWGLLFNSYKDGTQDISTLQRTVRACGIEPAETQEMPFWDQSTQGADVQASKNAVTKLKAAGVTTVLCLCHQWPLAVNLMPEATNQGWFPEWLLTTTPYVEMDNNVQKAVPEQIRHAFGVLGVNKAQPTNDLPVTWAIREMQPGYSWQTDIASHDWSVRRYVQLLLLASGIQLAGPKLTPHTFAAGLQKTVFPNPQTQYYAGRVSFAGDHSMVDDYAEVWWGVDKPSVWGAAGAWCYVDDGARHKDDDWPSGDRPVFQGDCY